VTFDEQLSRAADALTGRLRDDIGRHVQAATAELAAIARADREQAEADVRSAAERRAAEQLAAAVADAEARGFAFGQDAGLQEARISGARDSAAATTGLVDEMRALDAARSLTATLDALVSAAAAEAGRAAVLLVRAGRAQTWRRIGFTDASEPSHAEFAIGEHDVIGQAAASNRLTSAQRGMDNVPAFAGAAWNECVCAPIALADEVVAVLYADAAGETTSAWRQRVELLARHAARCLESVIGFKAARMLATPAHPAGASIGGAATSEEENGARRYARLLVSEIRLYHEDAVAAGRRERDLASRLGGEIARARMLYEQRVAPRVRQRADYFQDELVRTLADGDPALLDLRT